jgi:hypothetical protein
MLCPDRLAHLRQQFLPKCSVAQTPAAPYQVELRVVFLASRFQRPLELRRPAGLSFGMPHSPSNRSTRSQAGRFDGASRYAGQLLQPKRRKGWSTGNIPRPWTQAGLRWT